MAIILTWICQGSAKEDIKAELADGYLTIRAEKKSQENRGEGSNYIFQERYHGTCQRSFYVGEGVEQEDIHAATRMAFCGWYSRSCRPRRLRRRRNTSPLSKTVDYRK